METHDTKPPADGRRTPPAGSLAELVGFEATKSFRAARRAMRPVVGDEMVTRRDGILITARVCRKESGWIYWERVREDMPEWPETCVVDNLPKWRALVIKALRMGSEFRPANS